MNIKYALIVLLFFPLLIQAQYGYITGKVYDKFGPISNAAIQIKDSPYGTFTDSEGYFAFEIDTGYHQLSVEITGYNKIEKAVILYNLDQKDLEFEMESALMDADVSVGSKSNVTQNQLESPVPIDVIYGEDLVNTGELELSHALHALLPNFYSVRQSTEDGTNMVDPISLRGLGPDQVLVLVNGKRRHKSAFLNTNDIFGRGTAPTDLNAIPILAIERIEVLRDGASSQYGSDAIAGVINIVLKDQSSDPVVILQAGGTTEGDGIAESVGFSYGFNIKRRGYVNLTGIFADQEAVNRAGNYDGFIFGDLRDSNADSVSAFFDQTGFGKERISELGSSKNEKAALLFNGSFEITENMDLYSFGGISYRDGRMDLIYRLPALEQQVVEFWYPSGFSPKLHIENSDRSLVTGVRGEVNKWFLDFSYGLASNDFELNIENSNNASLGLFTPTAAFAGAYKYNHDIISFDATRTFNIGPGHFDVSFGTEYRIESYELEAGEPESYIDGGDSTETGLPYAWGMQGYIGIDEADALEEVRSNGSGYVELEYVWDRLLLAGAARYETYSDFGENFNYKLAGRYKFANQFLIRSSYSTGFKAPSLHQIYYQRVSNQLIDEELQNVVILNSENTITGNGLGLVGLDPEISESFSIGITSNINRNISLSIDAYETNITDRIGLISRIDVESNPLLRELLEDFDIQAVEFFTNVADTRTEGLDAVLAAQYNTNLFSFNLNSGFSYMQTRLEGELVSSQTLDLFNIELADRAEIGRIERYVPETQWRNSFKVGFNRFKLTLTHVRFGSTEFIHPDDELPLNWEENDFTGQRESRDQTFSAKHILNADLSIRINKNLNITLGGLNLADQYPDKLTHSSNTTFGINPFSPNVRPFDLRGTYLYGRLNITL